jgi:hypothetical protein
LKGSYVVSGRAGADDSLGLLSGRPFLPFYSFSFHSIGFLVRCFYLQFSSLVLEPSSIWSVAILSSPVLGILQAWRRLYSTVAVRSLIFGSPASTAINTASVIDLFRYPAG